MSENIYSSFYLYKEHRALRFEEPIRSFIQYKKFRLDLINGEKSEKDISHFFKDLTLLKMNQYYENPIVIHLMYELGYSCVNLDSKNDENSPLAIFIEYSKSQSEEIYPAANQKITFESLSKIDFEEYKNKFNQVYESLLSGETYQLNLTHPFYLRPNKILDPDEMVSRLWSDPLKVGPYAHATFIGPLDKLYFSNSPECLFQILNKSHSSRILTMPIKGTEKIGKKGFKESWTNLESSKKNQAELYMITDLMRNDLTRLTKYPSRVVHKKYPLQVPGLVHQFSVVDSKLPIETNLKELVLSLFPGGSITGAPKRNTMKLIEGIEKYKRGFYCGSTILLYENKKTASINIRSAEIDYGEEEIKYGAGGGITLQSKAEEEFEETLSKLKSFLILFELKKSYN